MRLNIIIFWIDFDDFFIILPFKSKFCIFALVHYYFYDYLTSDFTNKDNLIF